MGNRNTLNPFYPTINLTLDNTIFSMQANFLVSDYTTLQNLRESNNGLISDYRQAFAFILSTRLSSPSGAHPSQSQVAQVDDSRLLSIINLILEYDSKLREDYDKLSQFWGPYYSILVSFERSIQSLQDSLTDTIYDFLSRAASVDSSAFSQIIALLDNTPSHLHSNFHSSVDFVSELCHNISDTIKEFNSSYFDSNEKNNLISIYQALGTYGWTLPPTATWFDITTVPQNQSQANQIMSAYITASNIASLLDVLRDEKRVKRPDFEEAVFCYKNRKYKSCAMLLFSLIDGIYLHTQPSLNTLNQYRKVGIKGISRFQKDLQDSNKEAWLFSSLLEINVVSCLSSMYKGYNSFNNEPTNIINRNFVMHGMGNRKVLRRDCIQLFLLYYNVLNSAHILKYQK